MQIIQKQDKAFTVFLWLLSLVSLYYHYRRVAIVQQIPLGKGIVGLMMMASEAILIVLAVRAYKECYVVLHPVVRFLILLTIVYNTAHILYTTIWEQDVAYLSLFGNPQYQPLFMLPIAFLIGLKPERFFILFKCVWYYVLSLVPIYILTGYFEPLAGMGILFLLAFATYLPKSRRLFLLGFAVLYILFSYRVDARASAIRAIMGVAILLFSITPFYKSRIVKAVIYVIIVALPLYFLVRFVNTGESIFEQLTSSSYLTDFGEEHSEDTRTFLYEEVFDDLTDNDAWVLGKSITGTYYSNYFDNKYSTEKEYRFGAEVGVLFFLLKGGLIQFVLYMLILLIAIYRCLFFSQSKCVVLIGLVLLSHYVLLFIEEVPHYDLYNIAIWLYVGMASSASIEEQDEASLEEKFDLIFSRK